MVSDNIQTVALPTSTSNTFVGVTALISGFGRTSQSKCVDPFNLYSTDKEQLLYSQCHMDLTEVTQKYMICNPTVTPFKCNSCMSLLLSMHVKGCVRTGIIFRCHKHRKDCGLALVIKFKFAWFEVLTVVLLIPEVVWNIRCVDCKQLLTFQGIIVPSTSGSNSSRLLDPVSV